MVHERSFKKDTEIVNIIHQADRFFLITYNFCSLTDTTKKVKMHKEQNIFNSNTKAKNKETLQINEKKPRKLNLKKTRDLNQHFIKR